MACPIRRRRLLLTVLLAFCASGWLIGVLVRPSVPVAWSAAHAWHFSSNGHEWVANDDGRPAAGWTGPDAVRRSVAVSPQAASAPTHGDAELETFDPLATTETSDQSDASARIESRAGPLVSPQSRAVPVTCPGVTRSRTRSGSTPRAPPASLRFA